MKGLGTLGILGIFVALAPNMGLTGTMRDTFVLVLGLSIAVFAFYLKNKTKVRISGTSDKADHKPYIQNDVSEIRNHE